MSAAAAAARPPEFPELPEAARPRWPPWMGPVAMLASAGVVGLASVPMIPLVLLLLLEDGELGAMALLILLLVQDMTFVGGALLFAGMRRRPRGWHFGLRATRLWPTAGWAALVALLLLGFELGYIELLGVEETNVEELSAPSPVAELFVCLGVILVAPVTEEFFFRGFFYRALRSRLRVWSAALIDGVVFGALHFQGEDSLVILPVIGVFGAVLCVLYERTQSLVAVIGVHAAFNTFAMAGSVESVWVPLLVGAAVIGGCALAGRSFGRQPTPFPVPAR